MALAVVTFVHEGIVMASDSRKISHITGQLEKVNISDSAFRTFLIEKKDVGISTFGQEVLNNVPVAVYIKSFIKEKIKDTDNVSIIAEKFTEYFSKKFPGSDLGLHVAGYQKEEKANVPFVYSCRTERNEIIRRNIKKDGSISYGAIYSGTIDILQSIINPVIKKEKNGKEEVLRKPEAIDWETMPLQDAIDFAIYAIHTTVGIMRFQTRTPEVGGPIDVLLITPDKEPKWIQKKSFHGENT